MFGPETYKNLLRSAFFIFLLALSATSASMALRNAVDLPFNLDEVEEAGFGRRFSQMGPDIFRDVPGGGSQISHPLLYTFTHAAVQKVFGYDELPLRLYGVFHYLLCIFLIVLITRKLLSGHSDLVRNAGASLSALLFAINPLIVQHSIIVNADNNILTTAILLFMYFFVSYEQRVDDQEDGLLRTRILLGIFLAICLWSKLFAPLFMISGIMFARVLAGDNRKTLADAAGLIYWGIGLFWLTWWLYCRITDTELLAFIKFTVIDKGAIAFSSGNLSSMIRNIIPSFRWPVYWVSAPFFVFIIFAFFIRAKKFFTFRSVEVVDIILISAVFMWLPFQFFKPNIDMMKYQYPSYPLFFIAAGYIIADFIDGGRSGKTVFLSKFSGVLIPVWLILTYHYYRIGDYILVLWQPVSRHIGGRFLLYYYVPIFLTVLIILAVTPKRAFKTALMSSLIFLMFPINAGLLFNQARADYITAEVYLNYGERGFRETVKFLSERVSPDMDIVIRSDLRFYLSRAGSAPKRSHPPRIILRALTQQSLRDTISSPDLGYIVLDQIYSPERVGDERMSVIAERFALEKQIGSFYILRRR